MGPFGGFCAGSFAFCLFRCASMDLRTSRRIGILQPNLPLSSFPHPKIRHSMDRFAALPATERAKARFIHLNHTNPALVPGSEARRIITENGFAVAEEMERVDLAGDNERD